MTDKEIKATISNYTLIKGAVDGGVYYASKIQKLNLAQETKATNKIYKMIVKIFDYCDKQIERLEKEAQR